MIKRILKRLLRLTPDYSNGQWHSWYGGPCPVSPGALVQAYIYPKGDHPVLETVFASELDWAHKDQPIARFRAVHHTLPAHGYNWQTMDFDAEGDSPASSFLWDEAPEGAAWWTENFDTDIGLSRFAEMKRLYAADMQHRHNDEAMKQSARNSIPADLED